MTEARPEDHMFLHAEYKDGFTDILLTWQLAAQDGMAHARARWLARSTGCDSEGRFPFDERRIAECLSVLEPLEEEYSGGVDDASSCELRIAAEGRRIRRYIDGGDEMRQRFETVYGVGEAQTTFSAGDARDVRTFFSVWEPIERDVLSCLNIPGRQPMGMVRAGRGTRVLSSGFEIPADIWIDYEDEVFPIVLAEGTGESRLVCRVKPQELFEQKWASLIEMCRGQWLLDEIQRLADAGQEITPRRLELARRELRQSRPAG